MNLANEIERLLSLSADEARREGMAVVQEFRQGLSRGEFRAAEKTPAGWKTNAYRDEKTDASTMLEDALR